MWSRYQVRSRQWAGRGNRRKGSLSVALGLLAALAVAACGESSGSDGSTEVTFSDTGTFNQAKPEAPSVEGAELAGVGEVPEPDGDVRVGVLLKTLTNQYWQQVEAGIEGAKEEFGVDIGPIQGATSENAQQEQLQICQTLLQQDFDALIVAPETTSNLNPCLDQAESQGTPLINIAAPGPKVPATVY